MEQSTQQSTFESKPETKHLSHRLYRSLFFLLIGIVVIGALFIVDRYIIARPSKAFSAVFLSNGQVYFGHLVHKPGRSFIELVNIYYLQQSDSDLQQGSEETQNPELSLVKLGNELHGPTDRMFINKEHILFMETLRSDSQVVKLMK